VAHRLGYITDDLAIELEKQIKGVGAPLGIQGQDRNDELKVSFLPIRPVQPILP